MHLSTCLQTLYRVIERSAVNLCLIAGVLLTANGAVKAQGSSVANPDLWNKHLYKDMSGEALVPLSPQEHFGELHVIECTTPALAAAIESLNNSVAGGTIRFRHNNVPRTISLDTLLFLKKKGHLYVFDGEEYITLNGQGKTGMIRSTNQLKIIVQGMNFINGRGETGSAIYLAARESGLMVINCNFTNNHNYGRADINGGGAVKIRGLNDVAYFSNCRFNNNSAYTGGAIGGTTMYTMVILDCEFNNNRSLNQWDGISTARSFDVTQGPFVFNFEAGSTYTLAEGSSETMFVNGQGFYDDGTEFTVTGGQTITFDRAGRVEFAEGYPAVGHEGGGAVRVDGTFNIVEVYRSSFVNNSSTLGASGLEVFVNNNLEWRDSLGRPSAIVDQCYFKDNHRETDLNHWTEPKVYAGAIRHFAYGRLELTNSVFLENEAELGTVFLRNQSDGIITNNLFARNTLLARSEPFRSANSTIRTQPDEEITIRNCTFFENSSYGHTLFLNDYDQLSHSIFESNINDGGIIRFMAQGTHNIQWPDDDGTTVTSAVTFRDSKITLLQEPSLGILYDGSPQRPVLNGAEVGAMVNLGSTVPVTRGNIPEIGIEIGNPIINRQLRILNPRQKQILSVKLYNVRGTPAYANPFNSKGNFVAQLSKQNPGIYLVEVKLRNSTIIKKVILP